MAETRDMSVDVNININTHYPTVPSTMEERIKAAQAAKPLLANSTMISSSGAGSTDLVYLAEYLATGHTYFDTHPEPDKKLVKKARRKAQKELRKIVQEEVEEELDRRQREGAGTLIVPETLVEREDGTQTPMADFVRKQQAQEATWPVGVGILAQEEESEDGDEWIPKGETRDA